MSQQQQQQKPAYLPMFCTIPGHPNNGQPVSVEYAKHILDEGRLTAASTFVESQPLSAVPRFQNDLGLHVGNKVIGTNGKTFIQFH